jgi:hypothetical protein
MYPKQKLYIQNIDRSEYITGFIYTSLHIPKYPTIASIFSSNSIIITVECFFIGRIGKPGRRQLVTRERRGIKV